MMLRSLTVVVVTCLLGQAQVSAFAARPLFYTSTRQSSLCNPLANSATDDTANNTQTNPSDMRLREIQNELKERKVSYTDCFDRESLVKRLVEAREKHQVVTQPKDAKTNVIKPTDSSQPDNNDNFDKEATIAELRELRVKVLKEKLSEYKVRWGTMIEKEEMVQALCNAMEERFNQKKNFSRSGSIIPGVVTDVTEGALIQEMGWLESDVSRGLATKPAGGDDFPYSPILLDVYATWCGPCKLVAPQLELAAQEMGSSVRFMKIDSDKYQRLASLLRIGGLPTLIYFDGGNVSREVKRVEGALMKDQIVSFVNECGAMSR